MPNTRQELVDRFIVVSGAGRVQAAVGTGIPNAELDTRDKCTITRELVVDRRETRDCRNEFLIGTKIRTRYARVTLTYAEVTPQIIHRWTSQHAGATVAPTGVPANEVQTLTVNADGTLALTLEGRTVTTKNISATATAAQIQAALTAARMLFVQPGDVAVTGAGPFTLTFPDTGRLGRANLPLLQGTGGMVVTPSADGNQRFHVATISDSRVKERISFALGWDTDPDRVEKYIDYAVESITPTAELNGDVGLTVTLIGPWDYDSIEEAFDIPECVNIDPLATEDCRLQINGEWLTTDINSITAALNDNIPLDRLSAFPFDGMDIQTIKRGRQPSYSVSGSIFGSETDPLYQLAHSERTASSVPVIIHFGMPGNRCTWQFPETEIQFQTNPLGAVGASESSTIQFAGVPLKDGLLPPVNFEGYLDQATQFLLPV